MAEGSQFPDLGQFFGEVGSPGQMMPTNEASKACPFLEKTQSFCGLDEELCPFVGFNYRKCRKYISQMARGRSLTGINSIFQNRMAGSPVKNVGSKIGERLLSKKGKTLTEGKKKEKDPYAPFLADIDAEIEDELDAENELSVDDAEDEARWQANIAGISPQGQKEVRSVKNLSPEDIPEKVVSKLENSAEKRLKRISAQLDKVQASATEAGIKNAEEEHKKFEKEVKADTEQLQVVLKELYKTNVSYDSAREFHKILVPRQFSALEKLADEAGMRNVVIAPSDSDALNLDTTGSIGQGGVSAAEADKRQGFVTSKESTTMDSESGKIAPSGPVQHPKREFSSIRWKTLGKKRGIHSRAEKIEKIRKLKSAAIRSKETRKELKGLSGSKKERRLQAVANKKLQFQQELRPIKKTFISSHKSKGVLISKKGMKTSIANFDYFLKDPSSGETADGYSPVKTRTPVVPVALKAKGKPEITITPRGKPRTNRNQALDKEQFDAFWDHNWEGLTTDEKTEFFGGEGAYDSEDRVKKEAEKLSALNDTDTLVGWRNELKDRFKNVKKYHSVQAQQERDFHRDLDKAVKLGMVSPRDIKDIKRRASSDEARGVMAKNLNKFRDAAITYDIKTTKVGNHEVIRVLKQSLIPKFDKQDYEVMRMSEQAGLRAIQLHHQYGKGFGKFNTWSLFIKQVLLPSALGIMGLGPITSSVVSRWPDAFLNSFYMSYMAKILPKYKGKAGLEPTKDSKFWASQKMASPVIHDKIMRGYEQDAPLPVDRAVMHTRSYPTTKKSWSKTRNTELKKRYETGKVTRTSDEINWRSGFSRQAVRTRKTQRRH